jgi:hypothetical protein
MLASSSGAVHGVFPSSFIEANPSSAEVTHCYIQLPLGKYPYL